MRRSSPSSGRACPRTPPAHVERRTPIHPSPRALEVSQDRLMEKALFLALGIEVARFAAVDDRVDAQPRSRRARLPRGAQDAPGRVRREGPAGAAHRRGPRCRVVEARRCPADPRVAGALRPRALRAGRCAAATGRPLCYPLVQNTHADGILRVSQAPAPELTARAPGPGRARSPRQLLDELDYVGVLAVELFELEGRSSRTSSRRACTTRDTGRSRAPRRASSRTMSARSSDGRSDPSPPAGPPRW